MRRTPAPAASARAITGWTLGVFALFLVSTPLAAWLTSGSALTLPAWHPDTPVSWIARVVVMLSALSGTAIAIVIPGLPWSQLLARRSLRVAALFSRGFALTLLQAAVFLGVWKALFGTAPTRAVFVAWQAAVTAAGVGLLTLQTRGGGSGRPSPRAGAIRRHRLPVVAVGAAVLLVVLPLFLWNKTFVDDGSGDSTEAFEFSKSLTDRQLPNWDLENGYYGFYPNFMLFAYPIAQTARVIGIMDATPRLPAFFYVFGIFLVAAELMQRRGRARPAHLAWLAFVLLVYVLYHARRSTYELVTDLAEPFGVDVFFTFLAASAFYALQTRVRVWWGVFAVMGSLALSAGLPFAVLFLASRALISRAWRSSRRVIAQARDAMAVVVPWLAYQAFVAAYAAVHPLGTTKWDLANSFEQYALAFDPSAIGEMNATLAVSVGILPVLLLPVAVRRDRLAQQLAAATVGYACLLAVFDRNHPHYAIPLGALLVMVMSRYVTKRPGRAFSVATVAVHVAVLSVVAGLALPSTRRPHTTYRRVGAETLFLVDAYPDAVRAAEAALETRPDLFVHLPLGKPLRMHVPTAVETEADIKEGNAELDNGDDARGLSAHLWVRFSDRARVAGKEYAQIITARQPEDAPMDGYAARALGDSFTLYFRPNASLFR